MGRLLVALTIVSGANTMQSWMVMFHETSSNEARSAIHDSVEKAGGEITRKFTLIPGFAAKMTKVFALALQDNPAVQIVEPDGVAKALDGDSEVKRSSSVSTMGAMIEEIHVS